MEAVTSAVEKVKGFIDSLFHRRENSYSRNPIEILKRLQRESFSEQMKQRDRLDKVERLLSFYKLSKGSPFQEASTHVRAEVDVLGAVLMMGGIDQRHADALDRAEVRTGIHTRFTFETTMRQNDTLVADFVACQEGGKNVGNISGRSLSLAKLSYVANIGDWFYAIAVPVGAQCRDFDIARNYSHKAKGLTTISSLDPPLLSQHNGGAIGFTVRKSNVVASLAQSVSGLGVQLGSDGIGHCLSTFGQVVCQLSRGVNLSLVGLHQRKASENSVGASASSLGTNTQEIVSTGSIALKLETELDENAKVGGWFEMQNSNSNLRWAVSISDIFNEDLGWGVTFSGMRDGSKGWNQYQLESFLDLCLGKRFSLKLGTSYVADGDAQIPALMLRCIWSL
ncbi:hypothetical protein AB3S75_011002 [Citrus x aurantiifolia]